MKKISILVGIAVFVILAIYSWQRKTRTTPTPIESTVSNHPTPNIPTPSGSEPSSPHPKHVATPVEVPEVLRSFSSFYKEKIPPAWVSRTEAHFAPSGPRAWRMDLRLDGIPVEGSDVRILSRNGKWTHTGGDLPPLPTEAPRFPETRSEVLERTIRQSIAGPEGSIRSTGKSWIPSEGALIPCERFDVDYRDDEVRGVQRETWCVNPGTQEIISKNPRGRF